MNFSVRTIWDSEHEQKTLACKSVLKPLGMSRISRAALLSVSWHDCGASLEDYRAGLISLFWCSSEEESVQSLPCQTTSFQTETFNSRLSDVESDSSRFTSLFKRDEWLLTDPRSWRTAVTAFIELYILHASSTRCRWRYLQLSEFTSLIWHTGKSVTLKKIAHIYTSITATCESVWKQHCGVCWRALRYCDRSEPCQLKARPVSKSVGSRGSSSSTRHQMVAAFEIQTTSPKIYPLCIPLLTLWGRHSITRLLCSEAAKKEGDAVCISCVCHQLWITGCKEPFRWFDNRRREACGEAAALTYWKLKNRCAPAVFGTAVRLLLQEEWTKNI